MPNVPEAKGVSPQRITPCYAKCERIERVRPATLLYLLQKRGSSFLSLHFHYQNKNPQLFIILSWIQHQWFFHYTSFSIPVLFIIKNLYPGGSARSWAFRITPIMLMTLSHLTMPSLIV